MSILFLVSAALIISNIVYMVAAIFQTGEDERFQGDKIIYRS